MDLTVEAQDGSGRHLREPRRWREHESKRCASLMCLLIEQTRLPGCLRARPGDDDGLLEPVRVQDLARKADRMRALGVREMLGLAVRALDEDARHAALRRVTIERVRERGTGAEPARAGERVHGSQARRAPRRL
jgi:hypothetical protein